MKSDEFYIEQVLSGHREAYAMLVERYFPVARAVALAQVRNVDDANDIAQEAMLKAYTALGELRNRKGFGGWLASITRNAAISVLRRKERQENFVKATRPESAAEPDMAQRELYARVRSYVEDLAPELRETVLLYYFSGRKLREIAEVAGISNNAAEKRLARARAALGERILHELMPEEDGLRTGEVNKLMGLVMVAPAPGMVIPGAVPTTAVLGGLIVAKKIGLGVAACVAVAIALWGGMKAVEHSRASTEGGRGAEKTAIVAKGNDETIDHASHGDGAAASDLMESRVAPSATTDAEADEPESDALDAVAPSGSGEIRGFVLDGATSEGIAGVVIEATPEDGPGEKRQSDPSDGAGAFVIAGAEAGKYSVSRRGAEGYQDEVTGSPLDIKHVVVPVNGGVDGLVFTLAKGVAVSGRVVDRQGAGVALAKVLIGGGTQIFFNTRIETGPDGAFTFIGLTPTGDVWLHATAEGLAHRMTGPVEIPPEGISDLLLTMDESAVVAGVLVDGKGHPIPRYQIDLLPDFQPRMGGCSSPTDEQGRFRIVGVFEGDFDVQVNPTDEGFTHPNRRIVDALHVKRGAQLSNLRVVYDVATDLTISGRVTDTTGAPMAGETVSYIPSEAGSASEHVLTDEAGYYVIENLADGLYDVDVCRVEERFIRSLDERYEIAAGSTNIDFVVPLFTTIRGRVLQAADDTPVAGYTATSVEGGPDQIWRVRNDGREIHDPEGRFALDMIEAGEHTVVIRKAGYLGATQTLTVTEGEEPEELVFKLESGAPLTGQVVNESGQGLSGASIYLEKLMYYDGSPFAPIAVTDDDGHFEILDVIAGSITLATVHPDYAFALQPVDVPRRDPIHIVLPDGGHVSGTAYLDGTPVSSGGVGIRTPENHEDSRLQGAIGEGGAFSFGPVPPGNWTLTARTKTGDGRWVIVDKSIVVEDRTGASLELNFVTGSATVWGDLRSDAAWRWCDVTLIAQEDGGARRYNVTADKDLNQYQINSVPPGTYQIEAAAKQPGSTSGVHVGVLEVPEGGEVRYDVTLVPEK